MQLPRWAILKETIINSATKTNVSKLKIIQIYNNGINTGSKVNFFAKAVPKKFKKRRKKEFYKKKKLLILLIRSKQ